MGIEAGGPIYFNLNKVILTEKSEKIVQEYL